MASETTTYEMSDLENRIAKGSRIVYVEPNDVYGMSNGVPLTPDYTDLCVSFDLSVETVPRKGYITGTKIDTENAGTDVTETYHFFWTSYQANADDKSNVVSFTKGEEYLDRSYLTTFYTDINFNDFRNKDVVEGLGVENVTITFESYYTPTIKIRFIDVRGASMFGREESVHEDDKITQDNIWGCFFTFPYPKFRLQVKGFYGHPVTYQLTCLDFRAKFDSRTGNFIIDVTFIGYDYGVMADIPTAYLIAAPLSRYVGKEYWANHCNTEEWRLTDGAGGRPPETFFEIKKKIKSAIRFAQSTENGETVNDGHDGSENTDALNELNALTEIINSYNAIITYLTSYKRPSKFIKTSLTIFNFKVFKDEYYMFQATNNEMWKKLVELTAHFYDVVDKFKGDFKEDGTILQYDKLIFGQRITEEQLVGKDSNKENAFMCDGTQVKFDAVTNLYPSDITVIYVKNIKELKKHDFNGFSDYEGEFSSLPLGDPKGYQILPFGKTQQIIQELYTRVSSSISDESMVSQEEQTETDSYESRLGIYEAAGIIPTIENVFKTIMCHLETLMAMIYYCKNQIDGQITDNLRTPEKLGISGYRFQSYNADTTSTGEINLPPWTGVTVDEPKSETGVVENDGVQTIGWVGDFEGETEWEEAKLIDGLSLAWKEVNKENYTIKENYSGSASIICLPTDVWTDVFPNDAINNPTSLGQYLAMRSAVMFGVLGYKDSDAESLGKADAINYLGKVGKGAIEKLTKNTEWKNECKRAPTKIFLDDDEFTARFTSNPGTENVNATIFVDNGDNRYRYVYTESTLGEKYGMAYIPEGTESSIIGSDDETKPFFVDTPDTGGKRVKHISANLNYKNSDGYGENGQTARIYYKTSSLKFIDANLEVNSRVYPSVTDYLSIFENEAMFAIHGGVDSQESYNRIISEKQKIDGKKLSVSEYEDKDISWTDNIKNYWNIDNSEDFLLEEYDVSNRWCVFDGTNTPQYIFNTKFYYKQNNKRTGDENSISSYEKFERQAAKCLLVLSSAGYDIRKIINFFDDVDKTHYFESIPYGALLLIGGLLWRAQQERDCIIWEQSVKDYKTHTTLSLCEVPRYMKTTSKSQDLKTILTGNKTENYTYQTNGTLSKFVLTSLTNDKGMFSLPCDGLIGECTSSHKIDINLRNRLIKEFIKFVENKEGWESLRDAGEQYEKPSNGLYTERSFTPETDEKKVEELKDSFQSNTYTEMLDTKVIVAFGSVKKTTDTDVTIVLSKSAWESYVDAFISKIDEIAAYKATYNTDIPKEERNKDKDLKRAMYMYLKRLWDRWFMMSSLEQYKVQNYMKHFVFMDSFYRNIGSVLHINCEKLNLILSDINGESMMYQMISSITTEHNCHFFALPDYFGFGDDNQEQTDTINNQLTPEEKIADMFKPIPFSKKEALHTSNKFIVMLTYPHSENLTNFNNYEDDGFDIFSHDGSGVYPATFDVHAIDEAALKDESSETRRVRRYGYNIPSFGVAFGRQNNHIFKSVDIGMTNPIATEQSINALSLIAERGGDSEKKVCFYGQDLFPVYNGYSYDCTVEMMGNVQVMPLMYFQLMNMPMFRGTYMVYSVTHTMRPGDMTTTFKGQKLSRYALPFAEGWYTASRLDVDSEGNFINGYYADDCTDYGNSSYRMNKGQKEMLISNNRGITREPTQDTYELLKSWQTTINVLVHTDHMINGVQSERYISLTINSALVNDVKKIFEEIYNTKVGGKYFAIKQLAGYNDSKSNRRCIHNKKYPNSKVLSYHAYGAAIDINWDQNPFISPDGKGDNYLTLRTSNHPVVKIFEKYGWGWGGNYKSASKDYMHFSFFGGK